MPVRIIVSRHVSTCWQEVVVTHPRWMFLVLPAQQLLHTSWPAPSPLWGVWTFPRVQQMEDSTRFWNFGRRRHRQQAANKQAAQQGSRQCRPRQPAPRRWTTQTGARPVAAPAAAAAAMTPAEAPQQARQRSHALSVCLLLRPGRWQLLQSEVQNGVPHQVRCGRF